MTIQQLLKAIEFINHPKKLEFQSKLERYSPGSDIIMPDVIDIKDIFELEIKGFNDKSELIIE